MRDGKVRCPVCDGSGDGEQWLNGCDVCGGSGRVARSDLASIRDEYVTQKERDDREADERRQRKLGKAGKRS